MNVHALRQFRTRLANDEPVYGLWITLESPSITEIAVALGFDWIVIDAEHGHLDWSNVVAHLRCVVRSNTVALVRVTDHSPSLVKRALDLGADGVVVPSVDTPEQLKAIVAAAHFPPAGIRGIGAERGTVWGQCFAEHVAQAEEHVLVVPLIESVTAGRNIADLLAVPGADVFFFGPADYSATAGYPGQWEGPGVAREIDDALQQIRSAGREAGVVADTAESATARQEQGFRMLGLGLDAPLLIDALRQRLQALGRPQRLNPDLTQT